MPKQLFFQASKAKIASCFTRVCDPPLNLTGHGVLIAVIDTGIDISHREFLKSDGTTRILWFWDQNADGDPPEGFFSGREYSEAQLNILLEKGNDLPEDISGHGTAVAGIAAGNSGCAPGASIIAVKLKHRSDFDSSKTSEIMKAVTYCIKKSMHMKMPVCINLSFGTNYGSHTGTSLLETYLDLASSIGRTAICAASGNEGFYPIHTSGVLSSLPAAVSFSVGPREPSFCLQLWKDYSDSVRLKLMSPSGSLYDIPSSPGPFIIQTASEQIAVYIGEPSPYQMLQEIILDFIPEDAYITSGIWRLILTPEKIRNGEYSLWLPSAILQSRSTRFLSSAPDNTLTIPSTARKVISVGAYDAFRDTPADFSGRGPIGVPPLMTKPEITAPGVGIQTPAPGGGYQSVTGTSFAAPFVCGAAAMLMEWGITRGNDPYLYGDKLKACLIKGARVLPGYAAPDPLTGWGALCVSASIPYI